MDQNIAINQIKISPSISESIMDSVAKVIAKGRFIHGLEHDQFEKNFAEYCGVSDCVAVGNGTDAHEIALRCVGVRAGDEVVLQANAGFYGTTAILAIGAIPVYADINFSDSQVNPGSMEQCISRKTRGVLVTHLYGKMGEVDLIKQICDTHGIALVEDCAQAHGAVFKEKKAGSWGNVAAFSFYPTKNLGAFGDGGAIVTSNGEIGTFARRLRQYGWSDKYHNICIGRNSRLDEVQAAILNIKLPLLDQDNERRRRIVAQYHEAAYGDLRLLHGNHANEFVGHLAVALYPDRDRAIKILKENGIETAIHYPVPDHHQPIMKEREFRSYQLINTEKSCKSVFTLPCNSSMTEAEVEYVCSVLSKI